MCFHSETAALLGDSPRFFSGPPPLAMPVVNLDDLGLRFWLIFHVFHDFRLAYSSSVPSLFLTVVLLCLFSFFALVVLLTYTAIASTMKAEKADS